MIWADTEQPLTKSERREVMRLRRRHRDIVELGPEALTKISAREHRLREMNALAAEHNLACFKCGSREVAWAKVGRSAGGRWWAVCVRCVRRPA